MNKNTKQLIKYFIYIILLVGSSIMGMYLAFDGKDLNNTIENIQNMDWTPLIGVAAIVVCSWLIDSFVLWKLIRLFKPDYKYKKSFLVVLVGYFFNGITPFASGGQVFQIYMLSKQKVITKDAIAALAMKFILFQGMMVLVSAIFVIPGIVEYLELIEKYEIGWVIGMAVAGLSMNIIVLASLFGVAYSSKIQRMVSFVTVHLLSKLKIIKNPDKKIKENKEKILKFKNSMNNILAARKLVVIISSAFVIRLILISSSTFIIATAINPETASIGWLHSITMTQLISAANAFMPIPGASGSTELSFNTLLEALIMHKTTISKTVAADIASATTLMWRSLTFYITTIIGFITFLIWTFITAEERLKKKSLKKPKWYSLQSIKQKFKK